MDSGLLDRRDSLDLLQDLDFGIMDLGTSADQQECNDIMDIIGRKDSGGGDEGHGGGANGGSSGDGAVAAGTGSNGGGGNAEASAPDGEEGSLDLDPDFLLGRTAWALGHDGKVGVSLQGSIGGLAVANKKCHKGDGGNGAGRDGDKGTAGASSASNGDGRATGTGGLNSGARVSTAIVGAGAAAGAGGNGDSDREIDVGLSFRSFSTSS